MAPRKHIENTGGEAAANRNGASEPAQAKSELPTVESPPLSPGTEMPAIAADTPAPAIATIAAAAPATRPRLVLKARHKRYAMLAASVMFAAALGAVVGALASGGFFAPARNDVAGIEQNKAMAQSIARLGKEITTLKASLEHAGADVTGSITARH